MYLLKKIRLTLPAFCLQLISLPVGLGVFCSYNKMKYLQKNQEIPRSEINATKTISLNWQQSLIWDIFLLK